MYVVFEVDEAIGLLTFVADNPVEGDQEYVWPLIGLKPICAEGEAQVKTLSVPALTTEGVLSTITVTVSLAVQPFNVVVSMYEVVDVGFAIGLLIAALLKPVDGLQL